MIQRPIITDSHIRKALQKAAASPKNTLEYNRLQSRALRLVEIKVNEARFIQEGKEIQSIIESLDPKCKLSFLEKIEQLIVPVDVNRLVFQAQSGSHGADRRDPSV
jgi:hypothetical protein